MTTQPSDVEIAQAHQLQPIAEIAAKAGIPADAVIPYGTTKAKVDITKVDYSKENQGKLVLVTGVSPTPAGEGKSTVLIGLTDALDQLGKKAIVALREPSQGPVMGIKGGAAGGGYAQIVPMEDINLHFTGDFHAITSATNALAAIIDNHIHQGNALGIDPRRVTWQRCMDVNDRAAQRGDRSGRASSRCACRNRFHHYRGLRNHGHLVLGHEPRGPKEAPRRYHHRLHL